jgi:aryl-alcohol dehydrogenase-like predicted oxidoreductase
MEMEYRCLGRTGLRVSTLSLGGAPLGGLYGAVQEDEGRRMVHTALDLGINFIDVSPYYGLTRAETVLGLALRSIPRDRYSLCTKVGRYGLEDFDFSAARVTRSVDESLRRLGVAHVDVLLCHDIEFGGVDQIVEETLPALERVRRAGKVRFLGFSGLPLKVFSAVLDRTDVDVVLSYCHHTLFDTTLTRLLPYLKGKGVGVINGSPMAMGLLSDHGPPDWHPTPPDIRDACARAAALCRSRGTTLARLAIRFAASHPDIDTTLSGAANTEETRNNVAWCAEPANARLLAEVQTVLLPIKDRTWPSGRAENN